MSLFELGFLYFSICHNHLFGGKKKPEEPVKPSYLDLIPRNSDSVGPKAGLRICASSQYDEGDCVGLRT